MAGTKASNALRERRRRPELTNDSSDRHTSANLGSHGSGLISCLLGRMVPGKGNRSCVVVRKMMRPWCYLLFSSSLLMGLYRVSGSRDDSRTAVVQDNIGIMDTPEDKRRDLESSGVRDFRILTSEEIKERLEGLAEEFPNLVTLENAQDAFGLPAAGSSKKQDCPFDVSVVDGCAN
eukprot:scaffold57305_cov35-Attheya_sp.AAC.2